MLWCMLTTFFALSPDITAARADLSIKSMIFALAGRRDDATIGSGCRR